MADAARGQFTGHVGENQELLENHSLFCSTYRVQKGRSRSIDKWCLSKYLVENFTSLF